MLRRLWLVLWRSRWLIVAVVFLAVLLAVAVTVLQRPVYRSEATLQIESDEGDVNLMSRLAPAPLVGLAGIGGSDIQTDIAVLGSRRVAEPVVDSLALHVVLEKPRAARADLLRVLRAPRDAVPGSVELRRETNGSYRVRRIAGDSLFVPESVSQGTPFRLGDVELALTPAPGEQLPGELRITVQPFEQAVARVRKELTVLRPDPGAQILSVRFESPDPQVAAAVPNAVTRSFVRYKAETARSRSQGTAEFLRGQVADYRIALSDAEEALRRFRERAQIVAPEEQASQGVRRFAELQAERDELSAEQQLLGELFQRIDAGNDSSEFRRLASFPAFLSNAAVQDVLRSLNELETERSELLVLRTPQSVDVQGVNQRMSELQDQLYQLARNYHRNLGSQIQTLDGSLARSAAQLEEVPAKEVELFRLMREEKLLEEAYAVLQTRLKEEEIRLMDQPQEVRVVDPALVPELPASPRPLVNLAVGLLLGLIFGVAAAFLRDVLDTRVRTPEDAVAATLGLPVIGMIPREARDAGVLDRLPLPGRLGGQSRSTAAAGLLPSMTPTIAAEAYRGLRTQLRSRHTHGHEVLLVTSADPEEGKSTSAANLAVVFAQQHLRTLLVDADLRNGSLHRLFDVPVSPGLAQLLSNGGESHDTVSISVGRDQLLHLLPRGAHHDHPAELLASDRMADLVERWRRDFDVVLIDAPPVNVATDATLLAMLSDATLLIARAGRTERESLRRAVVHLAQLELPVRGLVLREVAAAEAYRPYPAPAST